MFLLLKYFMFKNILCFYKLNCIVRLNRSDLYNLKLRLNLLVVDNATSVLWSIIAENSTLLIVIPA